MEASQSLLVAMMFIMVLSIGIGNILTSLPGLFDGRSERGLHWLPTSWLLFLLLQHLNIFWNTLAILDVEEWGFGGFLYVIAGPIVLFLATSLVLPGQARAESGGSLPHYFRFAPRLFSTLALLMVWMIGVDLVLGQGFTTAGGANVVATAIFLVLATSQQHTLHVALSGLIWALFLSVLTLRGLGVVA